MIVLVDNYDSFTFNLFHCLSGLGADVVVHRNDKISVPQVLALNPEAIVLSPGPCTPNEAGICLELVERAAPSIPILGVCLGLQAIGQAFGGTIVRTTPVHGKVSEIRHDGSGLFRGINGPLKAARYHSLAIERKTMPDDLAVNAETGDDGLVMGAMHRSLPTHGVQFHPESIASEHGHLILKNFLEIAAAWNVKTNRRKMPMHAA